MSDTHGIRAPGSAVSMVMEINPLDHAPSDTRVHCIVGISTRSRGEGLERIIVNVTDMIESYSFYELRCRIDDELKRVRRG